MARNEKLEARYRCLSFGWEREFLGAQMQDTETILHSLDFFVYALGHFVQESRGRSSLEAMLAGCIPLVPLGHLFHNLLVHGESGFICRSFGEYKEVVHELHDNYPLRQKLSRQSAERARTKI